MDFKIPLSPHGQMRPRFSSRGKFTKTYKADVQQAREEELKLFLKQHLPTTPLLGPVSLHVVCYFRRPKSHYGTGRNKGELKTWAPFWHITTPDADNVMKMLKDCMNGLFFADDRQVCEESIKKLYVICDEPPCYHININQMQDVKAMDNGLFD